MVSVFSFVIYQKEKDSNYKKTENELATVINTLSISEINLDDNYIKKLSKATNTYIGIFDKKHGKFIISDTDIISMDIFLGIKNISSKAEIDIIDKKEVMYKAKETTIGNNQYIVVAASNLENVYVEVKELFIKLVLISASCFLLSYFIIKKFSKAIDKEIEKTQEFLAKIAAKDYSANISSSHITEFNTIANQLTHMKNSILKMDNKANKRAAKIRLKNTQLESILSSISHEFKNPIAIIKAASQTLKSNPDMSEKDKVKFTDKITKNSEKMVNLIDKIKLTFSSNQDIVHTTKFNLGEISKEVALELMDRYKSRNIHTQGDCEIEADKDLIRQVVQNLIENALKYSNDDIFIEIKEHSFYVIDKGIGISEDNINLVTKRYFRVNNNTWNSSLGLGLYIVKQILKAHNFKFIIESKLNEGSKIGFEF